MAKILNRAVLAGGRVLPAGTAWTQALASVPDKFWDGSRVRVEPDLDQDGYERGMESARAPEVPPRSGPGSGIKAWRAYADHLGLDYAADATRDDIIAAVDAN